MDIKVIGYSHFTGKNGKEYTNIQFLQAYGKNGVGSYGRNYIIPRNDDIYEGCTVRLEFGINTFNNSAYVSSVTVVKD